MLKNNRNIPTAVQRTPLPPPTPAPTLAATGLKAIQVKNTVPWTYVINDPNVEKIIGIFFEEELRKIN